MTLWAVKAYCPNRPDNFQFLVYRPEDRCRSSRHGDSLFSRLARAPSDHTEPFSHLAIVRFLDRTSLALGGSSFTLGSPLRSSALGAHGPAPFASSGRSSLILLARLCCRFFADCHVALPDMVLPVSKLAGSTQSRRSLTHPAVAGWQWP